MEDTLSFGHWVKVRRQALRLTQDALAGLVYCSSELIRKIEADARRPSPAIAERLAEQLLLSPQQRTTFVKAARGELRADRLSPPTLVPSLLAPPVPAVYRSVPPVPATPLIGRSHEVTALRNCLLRPDVRLLTLVGAPGIGKTRLALQVASELRGAFADDVCFVGLAPISDPNLVTATIAHALGVEEMAGHSLLDALQAFLRSKHVLLLLDNFEQVVTAAPHIAELLAAAARLKVLVTSRAALHLSAEHQFVVAPLELPDLNHLPRLEALTQHAAVDLFVQRAQTVKPNFILTEPNAPAVAEICVRLDGLPLAIELAAARVKLFSPQALLARLTHRLELLTGGPQDRPARQQTLRSTITWSYDLLDTAEQILFARLAVFVGGCTLEAAETICDLAGEHGTTNLPIDILAGLSALIDKSLLRQTEDVQGEPRFTMLETIREYALERLDEHGEGETLRRRHAVYYVALADVADEHLSGAEQVTWLQRLDAEIDNLRAALTWLRSTETFSELGLQLAGSLGPYWISRGYYSEGRTWLAAMLGRAGQPTPARGRALLEAGMLAWSQGSFSAAAALLEESLAVCQQFEDKVEIGWALRGLAVVVADQGDVERAETLFAESLVLFRELGYIWGSAWALAGWGGAAVRQDDLERAGKLLTEGLALFRELNDRQGIALSLSWLGYVATRQNDLERATALLSESLALSQELQNRSTSGWTLASLGIVAIKQHDVERAVALTTESLKIFRDLDERRGISVALSNLGHMARDQGAYERAAGLLAESLVLCRELGERRIIPGLLRDLGTAARAQGDDSRAATAFAESLTLSHSLDDKRGIASSLEQLAELAGRAGQPERVALLFGAAEILREVCGLPRDPRNRSDYDRAVAATRNQLGEATFTAAWAAGRMLSLEQAIAYALEGSEVDSASSIATAAPQ